MDDPAPDEASAPAEPGPVETEASSAPLASGVAVAAPPEPAPEAVAAGKEPHAFSPQTEEIVKRVKSATPGWEAAREQIMRDMATSDKISPDHTRHADSSKRAPKQGSSLEGMMQADGQLSTPAPVPRGRGRGRPPGRARGGGRGGKRKREERDDGDAGSSDSEVTTPVATITKSGRNIQKPSSFAPPQDASPTTAAPVKRKRTYRRNPEAAVCKICLRGTSPTSNMIVFCDGCNTPFHRFCHHPPIDQSVIDEVDKEWYCKQCQSERVVPVPESQVADFVAAHGAPVEQRQRYFASLPQGMLVTLLTKATTLRPDLPLFSPDFQARAATSAAPNQTTPPSANGHAHPVPQRPPETTSGAAMTRMSEPQHATNSTDLPSVTAGASYPDTAEDEAGSYPDHPPTYPRPGHGLMSTLPPEQEDLQWLVEDHDKYGVFTHMYQVDSQAANGGMS